MKTQTMVVRVVCTRMFCTTRPKLIDTNNGTNIVNLSLLQSQNPQIEAVVIVNNLLDLGWLEKSFRACSNIVIADGGANKLYNTPFRHNDKVRAIVGDLDSIQDDVKQFYEFKGVKVLKSPSQSINDFEKAFRYAIDNNWKKIICLGAFGGRMDHALSGMNITTKLCRQYQDLEVILVGRSNLMYYMRPNVKHEITISSDISRKGCGIVRFGSNVKVKTKGFKWNLGLDQQFSSLEWGQTISTSNQIEKETVEIESEGDLFFTAHFSRLTY